MADRGAKDLDRYLSKFETVLEPARPNASRSICDRIFSYDLVEQLPFVFREAQNAPDQDWPEFRYADAFRDPGKMLLNELRQPFLHQQLGDDHPINIRCDYGPAIMPSVFGLHYELTDASRPWSHHLESRAEIRSVISHGIPELRTGLGASCFETAEFCREILASYPKLSSTVEIYHPDLQSPFNIAHLIWGADIFYALYDCPDLVHELLSLVTHAYCSWLGAWNAVTKPNQISGHWNLYMKGGAMLRDDTAVTLSARHYNEFVKPYDQMVLDQFGGCIHFCGRGMAFAESMFESKKLYGINVSQPELNDIPRLLDLASVNRVVILGLPQVYIPARSRTGFFVMV